ncbi:hypothetical protein M0804_015469 [Polistes exclamans]|nr:hypothetical protein M0804_015469 [Polistes exclamans]
MLSRTENYTAKLKFLLLPHITRTSSAYQALSENLIIPANIQLADPDFAKSSEIDAIIGMEIFCGLWRAGQVVQLNESLALQNTRLGWIVRVEQTPEISIKSHEEERCEEHYKTNTRRDGAGRYVVRLPFKEDAIQLGDSYNNAIKRLRTLERTLARRPEIRSQNLYALEGMKFPRTIANGSENLELHGFCYASKRAYGACIYIKTTGLKPIVRLICAKSRVAPLKTQSLPRLELCGAVTLARL